MTRAVVVALALAVAAPARADDAVVDYVVQDGDSCLGIAVRVLGDRAKLREIHALNPGLGRQPHHLTPGAILRLPRVDAPTTADAHLTAARGDVGVRKPAEVVWAAAERGMDLFRRWRVGARTGASAEITFLDVSKLRLREQTMVVIYGPEKRLAKVTAGEVGLESGTLETRLGELDGRRVVVHTGSADADLALGRALVGVGGAGETLVSNHAGTPATLRKKGRAVKVEAGMGSRARPGKPPEPPRPLPPAPAWRGAAARVLVLGPSASVALAWSGVAAARRYRIAFEELAGGPAPAAVEVAAPGTGVEVAVPAGRYLARIAAIDADGFESPPSSALAIDALPLAVVPAGAEAPAPDAATRVPAGTVVLAPPGAVCLDAGARPAGRVVLATPGDAVVRCALANGAPIEPVAFAVAPTGVTVAGAARPAIELTRGEVRTVELALTGAAGSARIEVEASPGLRVMRTDRRGAALAVTVVAGDDAPGRGELVLAVAGAAIARQPVTVAATAEVRRGVRAGAFAFAGAHVVPARGGDARGQTDPVLGARLALARGIAGLEVDAQAVRVDRGDPIVGFRASGVLRGELAGVAPALVLGAGVELAEAAVPYVHWGVALTRRVGPASLRLDVRDQIGRFASGSDVVEVTFGIGLDLGR